MKQFYSLVFTIFFVIFSVACHKEVTNINRTITINVEKNSTLMEAFQWQSGDAVALCSGSRIDVVHIKPSDITDVNTVTLTTYLTGDIYAVYPSAGLIESDDAGIKVSVLKRQSGELKEALLLVGKSKGDKVLLSNVTSVLLIDNVQEDVHKIRVTANKDIAGPIALSIHSNNDLKVNTSIDVDFWISATPFHRQCYIGLAPSSPNHLSLSYIKPQAIAVQELSLEYAGVGECCKLPLITGGDFINMSPWEIPLSLGKKDGANRISIETNIDVSSYTQDNHHNKLNDYGSLWEVLEGDVLKIQTSANRIKVFDMDPIPSGIFSSYKNVVSISGLQNIDFVDLLSMNDMFSLCASLHTLDLTSFTTKNTRFMSNMFYGCTSLSEIKLSSFDTHNVEYMDKMFCLCSKIDRIQLSDSFSMDKIKDKRSMFFECGLDGDGVITGVTNVNIIDSLQNRTSFDYMHFQ